MSRGGRYKIDCGIGGDARLTIQLAHLSNPPAYPTCLQPNPPSHPARPPIPTHPPIMWGNWFGGSSVQKRKDAPKKAILDLRQQLDMLQKREKHLENQMAEQEKIAKANVSSNKTGMSFLVYP